MRIGPYQSSQNIQESDQVSRRQQQGKVSETTSTADDRAVISSHAKEVSQLKAQASNLPEVRQQRIDEIKSARAAGTYSVSNEQLAQSLFKEFTRSS